MAHLLTIPVIYIIGTQIIRNHHHWKHQQTVVYVPSVHYIQHRFMWNSEFRQFNKTADSKSGAERCPTQNKTKETGTNQHHTKLARQDSPHFRCSAVFIWKGRNIGSNQMASQIYLPALEQHLLTGIPVSLFDAGWKTRPHNMCQTEKRNKERVKVLGALH